MIVYDIRENAYMALPAAVLFSLILLIPRAAQKSLEVYRALQAYDAQPAPGFERRIARPQRPTGTVRIFSTLFLLYYSLCLCALFMFFTVMLDNGTRPILAFVRSAILPAFMTIGVFYTLLPYLAKTSFAAFVTLHRAVNMDTNTASLATSSVKLHRGKSRAAAICTVLLGFTSFLISLSATQTSSALTHFLVAGIGYLCCWQMFPAVPTLWPGKSSLRSRIVLLGWIFATIATVLVVFAVILIPIVKLVDGASADGNDKATNPNDSGGDGGFLDAWIDAFETDLPLRQLSMARAPFAWSFLLPLTADLLAFAYRFDVYIADPTAVELSEEDAKNILESSAAVAQQDQLANNIPHPWDVLGRYGIDMRTVRVPHVKNIHKPIFRSAMVTLLIVQGLDMLLELLFVPSSYYLPTMPLTRAEIDRSDMSSGAVCNFAPLLAYPFCLLAIIGTAWRRGGTPMVRKLWSYEEIWNRTYNGIPNAPKPEDTIDDNNNDQPLAPSNKITNDVNASHDRDPLLLDIELEEGVGSKTLP